MPAHEHALVCGRSANRERNLVGRLVLNPPRLHQNCGRLFDRVFEDLLIALQVEETVILTLVGLKSTVVPGDPHAFAEVFGCSERYELVARPAEDQGRQKFLA